MLRVDCTYGHDLPLGHLTREFGPGLHGLAGPNGAGKSSLLSTIAGEIDPLSGTVSPDSPGAVTRIAEPAFYPDLTVGEHLTLMGTTAEVIDRWALTELLDAPPSWLSSGQRQRVFLASQLPAAADVIVIDEPERHLDADWVDVLCAELVTLADDGAVVVVATHSPAVLAHCHDVIELG